MSKAKISLIKHSFFFSVILRCLIEPERLNSVRLLSFSLSLYFSLSPLNNLKNSDFGSSMHSCWFCHLCCLFKEYLCAAIAPDLNFVRHRSLSYIQQWTTMTQRFAFAFFGQTEQRNTPCQCATSFLLRSSASCCIYMLTREKQLLLRVVVFALIHNDEYSTTTAE